MKSLQSVFDLYRERFLRLKQRHLCVMAPADMHLAIAMGLADINQRKL